MRTILTRAIVVTTLVFATASVALSQAIDDTYLNSTTLIKFRKDATHEDRGSGFLILQLIGCDTGKKKCHYASLLVTNKHMLPPEHGVWARDLSIRVVVRNSDGSTKIEDVRIPILGEDGKYNPAVTLHPDRSVDVAVVDVGPQLTQAHADFIIRPAETNIGLTTSQLIPRTELKEADIGIGTQIYLLGYPSGIYDPRNVSPILRVGIISTEPDKDYSFNQELQDKYGLPATLPGFLIDANVFPGSSGSMVIRRTNIVPGFSPGGKRAEAYILGIVSGSVPIEDIWGTQRMGLGVVYRADTITQTIAAAMAKIPKD